LQFLGGNVLSPFIVTLTLQNGGQPIKWTVRQAKYQAADCPTNLSYDVHGTADAWPGEALAAPSTSQLSALADHIMGLLALLGWQQMPQALSSA